ncbi:ABC transporter G family member 27 [Hondaea fermentalgiana]|uniref:ABC transporter G family member 27 n=1 Tax=Hondaea fermentalgiana TaxID=2315210 RepID=A0A2R5GHY5_9STRA|nr:ABC transporter G family member 27 [Hondaea fermentalgiana]|eukprot:GBG30506.1 ABC transporter G family member 27 [Hondaea fermentalgiana]
MLGIKPESEGEEAAQTTTTTSTTNMPAEEERAESSASGETVDLEKGDTEAAVAEEVQQMPRQTTTSFPEFMMELRDMNRDVKIKKGMCKYADKRILYGINARFVSGELCALMGPSGAGKSSLLATLQNGNEAMFLNGQPLPKQYSQMVCVIPQADILFPALTPRQALRYSAVLKLPESTSSEEVEAVVDRLIKDLALNKCKDTPVGDENRRGVSGGERKRVSIGTELVTNPSILLVDEPSSGLDSTTAEGVVELLRRLAKENGQMVICTIHQPSYKLFTSFDKLLMLHHGRVVYNGQAQQPLHDYFNSIGFKSPAFENPLDYYMRELQARDEEDLQFFADKWAALDDATRENLDTSKHNKVAGAGVSAEQLESITAKNGWWHQFTTLYKRFFEDTVRDKEKFLQMFFMKLAIGALLGVVFINQARKDSVSSAFTSTSPLFFLVISAVFDTAFASILVIPLTRPLLVREFRNGAYTVSALFTAQVINNLLFDMLSSVAYSVAVPIVGLYPSARQYFLYLFGTMLITAFGSALGLMLGSTSKNVQDAQSKMIPVVMPLLLFCGFLIPYSEIPYYFTWLYWLSPFQYALSGLLIVEFEPRTLVQADGSTISGEEYLQLQELDADDLWQKFGILIALDAFVYIISYISIRMSIHKQAKST